MGRKESFYRLIIIILIATTTIISEIFTRKGGGGGSDGKSERKKKGSPNRRASLVPKEPQAASYCDEIATHVIAGFQTTISSIFFFSFHSISIIGVSAKC